MCTLDAVVVVFVILQAVCMRFDLLFRRLMSLPGWEPLVLVSVCSRVVCDRCLGGFDVLML